MIKDIFVSMDQAPLLLKRPLLPYSVNNINKTATYRIPLYAIYEPQATDWPEKEYYNIQDIIIYSILIEGRRYNYTTNKEPNAEQYTFHIEQKATFICVGFSQDSLWIYKRIQIIATSQSVYSLYGSKDEDGDPNPPMILNITDINKKADALKYSKFSFDSIKLSLIRQPQDRNIIQLFGGQMIITLRTEKEGQIKNNFPLGRYLIDKINYDTDEIRLDGIDYRYMLNKKYPNDSNTFNRVTYPYLEDKYINKIKPEAIGICNGVPGVCLNGLQIYTDFVSLNKITHYNFQFPPNWEELYKIEVKNGDIWSEIYPGLGNPFFEDTTANNRYRNPNPYPPITTSSTGIVQIYAMQVLEGGDWSGGVKEVRMYAKWKNSNPANAVKYILSLSDNDGILAENFQGEFTGLAPTGIYMDKSESLFYWIEQLQASNIIGGQLLLRNNSLFFKLENPNRLKKFNIPVIDVINHEDLSVELANDFWLSGWDIVYKKSIAENEEGHYVSNNVRYPTATIYNSTDTTVSFVYTSPKQQNFNTQHLQTRTAILNDLISAFRHKINNIQLPFKDEYLELEFYDVVGYLPRALSDSVNEPIDWLVYDIKKSIKNETITISLIERVKSNNWRNGNQ